MKSKLLQLYRHRHRRFVLVGGTILLICLWYFKAGKPAVNEVTFTARKGNLSISVLEGGSVEALESQEIRSEVKGSTKILKIIEEGYQVTDEDVQSGKVLVELDSSELRQKLIQEEIQFQSSLASYAEASQGYEIQLAQNISSIKAAEQKARFAKLDLEKYLGDKASVEVIQLLRLDTLETAAMASLSGGGSIEQQMLSAMQGNSNWIATGGSELGGNGESTAGTPENTDSETFQASLPPIDFSIYASAEMLGDGAAMQQLRKIQDELQIAKQQLGLSETKLAGTRRLFEKGFATKTEMDTEEISFKNNDLKVRTAESAYKSFIKYEFPKQAQ